MVFNIPQASDEEIKDNFPYLPQNSIRDFKSLYELILDCKNMVELKEVENLIENTSCEDFKKNLDFLQVKKAVNYVLDNQQHFWLNIRY